MTVREFLDALDGAGIIVTGEDAELNAALAEMDATLDTEIKFS